MQEEVTQKTIALVFKSSRLTADVLKKAMKMYLERRKAGQQATHGKMSVKKLVGQGMGASSIEVTDNNIKSFERVTRKYNVDFAVKKDKTVEPPKYMVFFKGKDADVITQAFKEFVKVNEKKRGKVSVKEKLAEFRELLGKDKNRERSSLQNRKVMEISGRNGLTRAFRSIRIIGSMRSRRIPKNSTMCSLSLS